VRQRALTAEDAEKVARENAEKIGRGSGPVEIQFGGKIRIVH